MEMKGRLRPTLSSVYMPKGSTIVILWPTGRPSRSRNGRHTRPTAALVDLGVCGAGGLRTWSESNIGRQVAERALVGRLATTPLGGLPPILPGRALDDRFASAATLPADLLPPDHMAATPGAHDWNSWRVLWRMILEQHPFQQPRAPIQ
jgi:hypothetical protein